MWLTSRDKCLKIGNFETVYRLAARYPFDSMGQKYTATTRYRSPESLLSRDWCGWEMDVWSAGCVLYEMTTGRPLFNGIDAYDQLAKIDSLLGSPDRRLVDRFVRCKSLVWVQRYATGSCVNERTIVGAGLFTVYQPNWPANNVLKNMIVYDPIKRLTPKQLLRQAYFLETSNVKNDLKICTKSLYTIPYCTKIPAKRHRASQRTKKVILNKPYYLFFVSIQLLYSFRLTFMGPRKNVVSLIVHFIEIRFITSIN